MPHTRTLYYDPTIFQYSLPRKLKAVITSLNGIPGDVCIKLSRYRQHSSEIVLTSLKQDMTPLDEHWVLRGDVEVPGPKKLHFCIDGHPARWAMRLESESEDLVTKFQWSLENEEPTLERIPTLALTLSGGGFRAALFHLGVVRFLADAGLLSKITHICSVSGGSVLAAHLVLKWDQYVVGNQEFNNACNDLIELLRCDMRGRIIRRWFLALFNFPLRLLFPRRWERTGLLEREYRRLFGHAMLSDLDQKHGVEVRLPHLHLLATGLNSGDLYSFNSQGVDRFPTAPTVTIASKNHLDLSDMSVSGAVACSSAFPPLFPPYHLTQKDIVRGIGSAALVEESITDGGVIDNLGVRQLQHLMQQEGPEFDAIFLSDAGAPLSIDHEIRFRRIWSRNARAVGLMMNRIADFELSALGPTDGSDKWLKISISGEAPGVEFIHPQLAKETRFLRTDLDRFTDDEINLCVMHGYDFARRDVLQAPKLMRSLGIDPQSLADATSQPWKPCPRGASVTANAPSSEISRLRSVLRRGRERRLRLFSCTDPASWGLLASFCLVIGIIGAGYLLAAINADPAKQWQQIELDFPSRYRFYVRYRTAEEIGGALEDAITDASQAKDEEGIRRIKALQDVLGDSGEGIAFISHEVDESEPNIKNWCGFVQGYQFPGAATKFRFTLSGRENTTAKSLILRVVQLTRSHDERPSLSWETTMKQTAKGRFVGRLRHPSEYLDDLIVASVILDED
jgi:predicted acylesterase/phospholipase RssA